MRILVIEDNKDIRELLKASLTAEMFAVDTVSDGERGSYTARTNDYDLILLDNILPKKHGPEICKEIRQAGKSTPIIMMSVKSDIDEKSRSLNIGADDYIAKPFSLKELLARIRAVLRRPRTVVPEELTAGNISINSRTHEVLLDSKHVHLTRKEFSLLELLVRHNGQTVSRGTIMEHVWDLDGNPFSNTIETHIFNLRRKLEENSKRGSRLIFNVPGRGYRIAA